MPNRTRDSDELTQSHGSGLVSRPSLVFGLALVIRIALAMVFLGGFDSLNAIASLPFALRHNYILIPYFPLVNNWLGLAGILDAQWVQAAHSLGIHITRVPVGIFAKLLPCLADSLLVAWLAADTRMAPRQRRLASWGYALCPLPLLIVSFEGQWDSIWLLFALTSVAMANVSRPTRWSPPVAGSLMAMAILVKPTPLLLLPLLLIPLRSERSFFTWLRSSAPVLLGALVTLAVGFVSFGAEGIDLPQNARFVFQYSATGKAVVVDGLSQISWLNHFGNTTVLLRDLSILAALVLVVRYHTLRRHTDPMATATGVLLLLPAIGGFNGQYLLWALPFLLVLGHFRMSVVHGTLSTLLIAGHNAIPGLWHGTSEETTFFTPIRPLAALAIPRSARDWLSSSTPTYLWRPLTNFIVPVVMIAIAVAVLRSSAAPSHDDGLSSSRYVRRVVAVSLPLILIFVTAIITYAAGPYLGQAKTLFSNNAAQLRGYGVTGRLSGLGVGVGTWPSIVVLLPLWTAVWALVVWRTSCRGRARHAVRSCQSSTEP